MLESKLKFETVDWLEACTNIYSSGVQDGTPEESTSKETYDRVKARSGQVSQERTH